MTTRTILAALGTAATIGAGAAPAQAANAGDTPRLTKTYAQAIVVRNLEAEIGPLAASGVVLNCKRARDRMRHRKFHCGVRFTHYTGYRYTGRATAWFLRRKDGNVYAHYRWSLVRRPVGECPKPNGCAVRWTVR